MRGHRPVQVGGAPAEQLDGDAIGAHRVFDLRGPQRRSRRRDRACAGWRANARSQYARTSSSARCQADAAAGDLLLHHRDRGRQRAFRLILGPREQRRHAGLVGARAERAPDFDVGVLAQLQPAKHLQQIPVADEHAGVALLDQRDLDAQRALRRSANGPAAMSAERHAQRARSQVTIVRRAG